MKKRYLSILLVVALCLGLSFTALACEEPAQEAVNEPTSAEEIIEEAEPKQDGATIIDSGTCGDGLTWELDDKGTLTIFGYGEMYHIWDERPSTGGASNELFHPMPWYDLKSAITKVIIKSGVKSIGEQAFSGCTNLTEVTIPESVTELYSMMEKAQFSGCSSLSDIYYEGNLVQLRALLYISSPGYSGLAVGSNVTLHTAKPNTGSCGEYTTWSLSDDGVLTISGTGRVTRNSWWGGRDMIVAVVIEDGVTNIYDQSFSGYTNLKSVTIAESVTSIDNLMAFCNCPLLTEITLPSGLTYIGEDAFRLTGLKEIVIPDHTSIGQSAFLNCSNLEKVTLGNHSSIGRTAFKNCAALREITIPGSISNVTKEAFSGCTGLDSVTFEEGVTEIGEGAFIDCSALKSVSIPFSVTGIAGRAFSGCTGITDVYYPGTYEAWSDIMIGGENDTLTHAVIHFGNQPRPDPHEPDHTPEYVEAVPASVESEGNIAYWSCEQCGRCFRDEAMTDELTQADTVIPKIRVTEVLTVTDKLKEQGIKTEEEIKDRLEEAANAEGYEKKNTVTIEVTLPDIGTAPLVGVSVLLPYPEGVEPQYYNFDVFHMINTGGNAGKTEHLIATETPNGLLVTVFSFSPFTIAWQADLNGQTETSAYFLQNGQPETAAENLRIAVGLD